MLDSAKVLITGATGKIGFPIARALAERNEVWGAARLRDPADRGRLLDAGIKPVVLDIAEEIRRASPSAWIVDFTNPVGIVTRALLLAGHRAIGLCNVAIGFQRRFAALLGVKPERVGLDHVGLNHLTWERAVLVNGGNRLPELLESHVEEIASSVGLSAELLLSLGVVPSYYLRYFYAHDEVVREQLAAPSRAAEVAEIERKLLELYADPAVVTKPELLARRGVLLRGGRGAHRLAARRPGRHAGGERAQRRHAAVPRRGGGDRGARAAC